jgi:hypothetical protein
MTATSAPASARPLPATRGPGFAAARLLLLELRRGAMLWMMPVAVALFWFTTYRKVMAMPPLWNLRATGMQSGALVAFVCPVVGAAAWTGSREARRHTIDLVAITAWPRWARLLTTWAATTCWAMVAYLGCVAVLYGVTAQQASWGGPLWWPAVVGAAGMPALSALGFAAGTLVPTRFTAPLAAVAVFFALVLSTELIRGSQSYWNVSPLITGPWDIGPDAGVGTFYPYLPDLPIAQVMFLAGLTVAVLGALALPKGSGGRSLRAAATAVTAASLVTAGTAVALAGMGKLDRHGMIAIPALHDAANDRPLRFAPVCSHTAIPVCLNPAYASNLTGTAAVLEPVLSEIAGLPGAPARISQAAATYQENEGNVVVRMAGPATSGTPPVYHVLLPGQLLGPVMTVSESADDMRSTAGPDIVAGVIGDGPGASRAQHAVAAALMMAAGLPVHGPAPRTAVTANSRLEAGTPAFAAAQRFAALLAPARHAWLVRHLAALRADQITLAQLP